MLQYKEDKKLRAQVKLSKTRDRTLKLESNEPRNTQSRGSKPTKHKSQTMTVCLLRGSLSVKGRKRQFFRFLIDVAGKRRKSKDVFDITGRLLSETAVKGNGND